MTEIHTVIIERERECYTVERIMREIHTVDHRKIYRDTVDRIMKEIYNVDNRKGERCTVERIKRERYTVERILRETKNQESKKDKIH
jgi:hypothetical protein